MCSPLESGDLPPVLVNPEASFEPVRDSILDLRDKVEELCNQELSKISKQGEACSVPSFSMFFLFPCLKSSVLLSSSQRHNHLHSRRL